MFGRKSRNDPGKGYIVEYMSLQNLIYGIRHFSENKKAYRALLLDSDSSMWTVTLENVLRQNYLKKNSDSD